MKTFCVIPAYNEEATIKKIINEVRPLVDKVVVIDDGSTDNTYNLAAAEDIVLLRHIINRGQGAALRTGTEHSLAEGAEIIVHFDADDQFLSRDIEKIIQPIMSGEAQVIFGSRFLDGSHKSGMPWLKKYLIMPLARSVNRLFFGINLTDPQSGFRAMSASVAGTIGWKQDGMAHCSEIMLEVKRHNFKVKEIPICVIYHNFGQNFTGGLKILKDLFIAIIVD